VVLKLELPLEPGVLRVIAAVQAGAREQGLEPLLVGARVRNFLSTNVLMARRLALWHHQSLEQALERSGESGSCDRKGNPKVHRAMPLFQSSQ
jgi:hypothetical protein